MGVILNKNKRKLAFDDEDLLVQEESPVIINQPNNQQASQFISQRNIANTNSDFKVAKKSYISSQCIPIEEIKFMQFIQLNDVPIELTFRDNSIAAFPEIQQRGVKTKQKLQQ